jgi:hypothetical protein
MSMFLKLRLYAAALVVSGIVGCDTQPQSSSTAGVRARDPEIISFSGITDWAFELKYEFDFKYREDSYSDVWYEAKDIAYPGTALSILGLKVHFKRRPADDYRVYTVERGSQYLLTYGGVQTIEDSAFDSNHYFDLVRSLNTRTLGKKYAFKDMQLDNRLCVIKFKAWSVQDHLVDFEIEVLFSEVEDDTFLNRRAITWVECDRGPFVRIVPDLALTALKSTKAWVKTDIMAPKVKAPSEEPNGGLSTPPEGEEPSGGEVPVIIFPGRI